VHAYTQLDGQMIRSDDWHIWKRFGGSAAPIWEVKNWSQ